MVDISSSLCISNVDQRVNPIGSHERSTIKSHEPTIYSHGNHHEFPKYQSFMVLKFPSSHGFRGLGRFCQRQRHERSGSQDFQRSKCEGPVLRPAGCYDKQEQPRKKTISDSRKCSLRRISRFTYRISLFFFKCIY